MAHYIDKAALVAEIERRKKAIVDDNGNLGFKDCQKAFNEIDELKKFINTLEVKEVDLEKETKKWWKEHLHLDPKNQLWMDAHQSIVFAEHFFELGMQVSNKAQKGE